MKRLSKPARKAFVLSESGREMSLCTRRLAEPFPSPKGSTTPCKSWAVAMGRINSLVIIQRAAECHRAHGFLPELAEGMLAALHCDYCEMQ